MLFFGNVDKNGLNVLSNRINKNEIPQNEVNEGQTTNETMRYNHKHKRWQTQMKQLMTNTNETVRGRHEWKTSINETMRDKHLWRQTH